MESLRVPIFPLNTVLFPGGLLPLRVFEARYMDMTRECLKRDEPFGVCLIQKGSEVEQQGILNLKTRGSQRFRILERQTSTQGLISAGVELIAPDTSVAVPEEFAACARLLQMVVLDQGRPIFAEPHAFEDAAWVGYRLTEILPVPLAAKQKLLELTDSLARLSILQRFLESRGLAAAKRPAEN